MIFKFRNIVFFFLFIATSLRAHETVFLDDGQSQVNEYSSLRSTDSTDVALTTQIYSRKSFSPSRLVSYLKENPSVLIYGTTVTAILAIGGYISFQEIIRSLYENGSFNLPYNHPVGNYTACPSPACLTNPDFPVYWTGLNNENYYASKVSSDNCTWAEQPHLVPGNRSLVEIVAERTGCNSTFLNEVQKQMILYQQDYLKLPDYLMCAPQGNDAICCANAWFGFPAMDVQCYGNFCLQVFKAAKQDLFADCMVKQGFATASSPLSVYVEVCGSILFFLITCSIWNAW